MHLILTNDTIVSTPLISEAWSGRVGYELEYEIQYTLLNPIRDLVEARLIYVIFGTLDNNLRTRL